MLRSDGTLIRDYIHVRDVVEGYLLLAEAMERPELCGRAYNFSLEHPVSVLDLTNLILRLMGREDLRPVILDEARAEIPRPASQRRAGPPGVGLVATLSARVEPRRDGRLVSRLSDRDGLRPGLIPSHGHRRPAAASQSRSETRDTGSGQGMPNAGSSNRTPSECSAE